MATEPLTAVPQPGKLDFSGTVAAQASIPVPPFACITTDLASTYTIWFCRCSDVMPRTFGAYLNRDYRSWFAGNPSQILRHQPSHLNIFRRNRGHCRRGSSREADLLGRIHSGALT
jgi:hypothetical protein